MSRMDPLIWSNLPQELLLPIIELCDKSTQIRWSCTNHFFYQAASKVLWKEVNIKYKDFVIPDRLNNLPQSEDRGILQILIKGPFRKHSTSTNPGIPFFPHQVSQLPGDFVSHIDLNVQCKHAVPQPIERYLVTMALDAFAANLHGLKSLRFSGTLFIGDLWAISAIRGLVSLELRTSGVDAFPPTHYLGYGGFEAADLSSEFEELEHLIHLKVLKVGQIRRFEGIGFANAIRNLRLTTLEMTVSEYNKLDPAVSPLAYFFRRLVDPRFHHADDLNEMNRPLENEGCLPVTLRVLKLADSHHSSLATRQDVLLAAFRDCEHLEHLLLDVRSAGLIASLVDRLSLPRIQTFTISGWKVGSKDDFNGLRRVGKCQRDFYTPIACKLQRIETVGTSTGLRLLESICGFISRHQSSLQRFEITNAMNATEMLACDINHMLERIKLHSKRTTTFSAQELRTTTPPADYFPDLLGSVYRERLSYRVFGMGLYEDRRRWGTELQRIRVEDIEWSQFGVTGFDSFDLQKLKILDLRSRFLPPGKAAPRYTDPWWDEYRSAPNIDTKITAVGDIDSTVDGRIAWDILELHFPSLRVIAVGAHRYWIEHNGDNRSIWTFEEAWEDKVQRSTINATLSARDWRFLGESSEKEKQRRDTNTNYASGSEGSHVHVDHRTNTVVFYRED